MERRNQTPRATLLLLTFAVCTACVLGVIYAAGCAGGEGSTVADDSCRRDCDWRYCGDDDGCGGTCGCLSGATCVAGACLTLDAVSADEVSPDADSPDDLCLGVTCAQGGVCCFGQCCTRGQACLPGGVCGPPCVPDCSGRTCGGDGCGGDCGDCAPNCLCFDGTCQCHTTCPGDALCGDQCCGDQQTCCLDRECCDADQSCVWGPEAGIFFCCSPRCTGRNCGPDFCGGTCGTCPAGQSCVAGLCGGKPLGPVVKCGDGTCSPSETCATCKADCGCDANGSCVAGVCLNCPEICTKAGAQCGLLQGCNCGACNGLCDDCVNNKCVEDCACRCAKADASCGSVGDCNCGKCSGTCKYCKAGDCVQDCKCRCKNAGATCGTIPGGCSCGGCGECEACAEGGCKLDCKASNCPCRGRLDFIKASLQGDLFGDDELDVSVTFRNSGRCSSSYRVVLLTKGGAKVDTEPDVGWRPLSAGQSAMVTLSTAYDWDYSAEDLKAGFEVRLLCGQGATADSVTL